MKVQRTAIQTVAIMYANQVLGEMVWGYENTLLDNQEGTEEYNEAVEILSQPLEDIVKDVVTYTMQYLTNSSYRKNAKFVGNEYIAEYARKKLIKEGYPKTKESFYHTSEK
jgi:hypothetical protein